MTYIILEKLKEKYKDGYRCIHTEIVNDSYTMQLKNFNTEKIKTLETSNLYEISEIKSYLNCLDQVKATSGHDC